MSHQNLYLNLLMQPSFYPYPESWPSKPILASVTDCTTVPPAQLYDFSGLGKLSADAGFVREIQQLFIDRVPGQLAELQIAIDAEDWEIIAQRAHSLKSTLGNLRMEPGTTLLKEMECLARQHGGKFELSGMLQVVAASADIVVRIFRQELNHTA